MKALIERKDNDLDELVLGDLAKLREERDKFSDATDPLGSRMYAMTEYAYRHEMQLFGYTRDDVELYQEQKEKEKELPKQLYLNI